VRLSGETAPPSTDRKFGTMPTLVQRTRVVVASALAVGLAASILTAGPAVSTTPVAAGVAGPAVSELPPVGPNDYITSDVLPFDMPSTGSLRASGRKVFANWVSFLPTSFDNKEPALDYYTQHYLNPEGENGKHQAYGGFMRDRPLGRAPIEGDWRLEDMKTIVRQAISAGIDGLTMVIYTLPAAPTDTTASSWNNAVLMMQAAAEVDPGFTIVPMPDMVTLTTVTPEQLAAHMAYLAQFDTVERLPNGRLIVGPYAAERQPISFWNSFMAIMDTTYGEDVALWPTLVSAAQFTDAFAEISYGLGSWGARDAESNATDSGPNTPKARIGEIQSLGVKWINPVSLQDSRPKAGRFVEAQNTQNLRNTWDITMGGGADRAQLATWNDLPEHSSLLPSQAHGWSFLDINAYYLTWFKTGVAPAIKRDAVYLTHRKHWIDDAPTYPQTKVMTNQGRTPSRDAVEALVFLRSPATVEVTVGQTAGLCDAPAGLSTCVVPLSSGRVSARIVRAGTTVASVVSPWAVSHTPYVQDLQYVAVSSLREGAVEAPPAPPQTTSSVSRQSIADAYVAAKFPARNFGKSSDLRSARKSTAFLRFRVPRLPEGRTLVSAQLRLTTSGGIGAGSRGEIKIRRVRDAWGESRVTWDGQPRVVKKPIGRIASDTANRTTYLIPLTKSAVARLQGATLNLALATGSSDQFRFRSRSARAKYRPLLVLTFR
jgi:hypothetical protein